MAVCAPKGSPAESMETEIFSFTDDLEEAINSKLNLNVDFDRIIICGMGGSAIGGDIIRDCVIEDVKCSITVQRFPDLPVWVNERTFALITSYSGNTNETLSMYSQAKDRGCPVVLITSGGRLEEFGKENGDIVIKLASGYQPRSALGMSLGYMANIVDSLCGTDCIGEIRKMIPTMCKLRDKLISEKSEARKIAKAVNGRIPIVYATSGIYASAIRWKSQINENSKMMAFAGSVPEFNHNEISGWSEGELRDKCVPIFLYEINAPKAIKKMADASISTMKKYGQDVMVVRIRGKTALQRTLRAVMVGDYVSLYLAYSNGVDPMDIRSINKFKDRLSDVINK